VKIRSYKLLFRLFSYLSDKTDGASIFVKYKLMLGTLIIGLTGSIGAAKAQKKGEEATESDSIPLRSQITCYKVYIPPKEEQNGKVEVTGKVIEKNTGEPLYGVNIVIKNSTTGTVTYEEGQFSIQANPDDIIIFRYIGFKEQEIPVSQLIGKANKIEMEDDDMILCYEIVIIGYDKDKVKPKNITKLPYNEIQTPPRSRIGNLAEFEKYVNDEVRYNEQMRKDKVEGTVEASFTIDRKGNVKNAKIIKPLHPYADAEVLRAISALGKWTPGENNGKKIDTTMKITVKYELSEK